MNKTLVVLAAGMGSRFGGLKQIEPVGPNGEFIIDYSVYDALNAGFNKVVFIIKKEMEQTFKETIGKRIKSKIKVEYAYQDNFDIPKNLTIPKNRTKPLGTAHALYVTRNIVKEPFAVISADDFYGKEPFYLLSNFLENSSDYGIIGYQIGDTLTNEGKVKRGIIFTNKDNKLTNIIESEVLKENNTIKAESLIDKQTFTLENNHPVSMLMYALRPSIFSYLEEDIKNLAHEDLTTCEYYLPTVLDDMQKKGLVNIEVLKTNAKWYGMTYKEDLINLRNNIKKLIEKGEYPNNLWKI